MRQIPILAATLVLLAYPASGENLTYTVSGTTQYIRHFDGSGWVGYQDSLAYHWGGASYIRLGDFDGDGRLQIASPDGGLIWVKRPGVCSSAPNCLVEENENGFSAGYAWGSSDYTWVGDFNGDGRDDIASGSASPINTVYMRLATGGALPSLTGFSPESWATPGAQWGGVGYNWVLDYDGDGRDEIASAVLNSIVMRITKPEGHGFNTVSYSLSMSNYGAASYTRVGDFNGDGLQDIASPNGDKVLVHLSNGQGFTSALWDGVGSPYSWGGAGYTWAADFDNDGRTDIASASGGVIHVLFSDGTNFPVNKQRHCIVGIKWGGSAHTWVMDYDGDGFKDIVSAAALSPQTEFYMRRNRFPNDCFADQTLYLSGSVWGGSQFTWGSDRF